jgi:mevalonate kinase
MAQNSLDNRNDETGCRFFYSKLLLFGEYSVIKDSMALAMPYTAFKGRLHFPHRREEKKIDQELKSFSKFLKKKLDILEERGFGFDLPTFQFDISQGLEFDSSIPIGYGVGSSGAICAALFDAYGSYLDDTLRNNLFALKELLAILEGHFHGASSGVDPLISYLGHPLLLKSRDNLEVCTLPEYNSGEGAIFLVNTERARRTEPLVSIFLEKCKNPEFDRVCHMQLLPVTNECINSFLNQDTDTLWQAFTSLSRIQFTHFTPMIPKLFLDMWEDGLTSGTYSIKLCGAGGGGFLLGMTKNFKQTYELLEGHNIKSIFRF